MIRRGELHAWVAIVSLAVIGFVLVSCTPKTPTAPTQFPEPAPFLAATGVPYVSPMTLDGELHVSALDPEVELNLESDGAEPCTVSVVTLSGPVDPFTCEPGYAWTYCTGSDCVVAWESTEPVRVRVAGNGEGTFYDLVPLPATTTTTESTTTTTTEAPTSTTTTVAEVVPARWQDEPYGDLVPGFVVGFGLLLFAAGVSLGLRA